MSNTIILDHMKSFHRGDTNSQMLLQHEKQQGNMITREGNGKLILNSCNPKSKKVKILIQNFTSFEIIHMKKLVR